MAEHVFTTLQHTIMDILIPSSDVIGDFIFAFSAFSTQNYCIGCLMMFPMLISMVFNFYKWVSTDFDTEKEKRYTWVLVVLCIWPQYQVIKLLLTIFRGTSKSIWKPMQNRYRKELSYIEPFIEAIPQFFTSMCVFALLAGRRYQKFCTRRTIQECIETHNFTSSLGAIIDVLYIGIENDKTDDTTITEVFGKTTFGIGNNIMFPITIVISMFSGIKVIVTYLHSGPLKITSNTKHGRAVVLSSMALNVVIALYGKYSTVRGWGFRNSEEHGIKVFLFLFSLQVAFPALISICPLARVVGLKKYARTILKHPELLILPLVTDYVPGAINMGAHYQWCCHCCKCWRYCTWACCCKGCKVVHTDQLVISKEMSWTKLLYLQVFWLPTLFKVSRNTNYYTPQMIFGLILVLLRALFLGITLHYGQSKGVLVIESMGNIRGELRKELELKLRDRINLQV